MVCPQYRSKKVALEHQDRLALSLGFPAAQVTAHRHQDAEEFTRLLLDLLEVPELLVEIKETTTSTPLPGNPGEMTEWVFYTQEKRQFLTVSLIPSREGIPFTDQILERHSGRTETRSRWQASSLRWPLWTRAI